MLAPVSMHVVLETTGADRFALIYDVLFCHGASPSLTKGFSGKNPFSKRQYPGTYCHGACEADLNWRPVNLACRPLNLAHLVEWLTKHIAVKYSPHISVFYAPTLARRVFNHLPFAFCFLSQKH